MEPVFRPRRGRLQEDGRVGSGVLAISCMYIMCFWSKEKIGASKYVLQNGRNSRRLVLCEILEQVYLSL